MGNRGLDCCRALGRAGVPPVVAGFGPCLGRRAGGGMRVVDLFCGAGGLGLGFAQAGYTLVAAADNWPAALRVYRQNFPTIPRSRWISLRGRPGRPLRPLCAGGDSGGAALSGLFGGGISHRGHRPRRPDLALGGTGRRPPARLVCNGKRGPGASSPRVPRGPPGTAEGRLGMSPAYGVCTAK